MGATLIEKHFTISRKDNGPDHKASLEPKELLTLVQKIRNLEISMGSKNKKAQKVDKEEKKYTPPTKEEEVVPKIFEKPGRQASCCSVSLIMPPSRNSIDAETDA